MKFLKIALYTLIGIGVLLCIAFNVIKYNTKQNSPQAQVLFETKENGKDLKITVNYSRPYKKGRKIFGGLVPFSETWRTGANEATVFTSSLDLKIQDKTLPAGKYTLWTVPGPESWQVVFNKKDYLWGIADKGKASRDPQFDALVIQVPVQKLPAIQEQFEIKIQELPQLAMNLSWDQTQVVVPFQIP